MPAVPAHYRWLYAQERGGPDVVSCNVYVLADGRVLLRPCEMPDQKVAEFLVGLGEPAGPPGPSNA